MGKFGKAKAKSKSKEPTEQSLKYVGPKDVKGAARNLRWSQAALGGLFLLDLAACLALFVGIHGAGGLPWPASWAELLVCLSDFYHDTLDLVVVTALRIAVLTAVAWLASGYAYREGWALESKDKGSHGHCHGHDHGQGGAGEVGGGGGKGGGGGAGGGGGGGGDAAGYGSTWRGKNGELTAPLLGGEARSKDVDGANKEQKMGEEEEDKERIITAIREEADPGFSEWASSISAKDVTLFVSFLFCTVFQVYVGAKCVSFAFDEAREGLQGWLMGSAVVWINLESTALGSLAEASGVLGRASALADDRGKADAAAAAAASDAVAASECSVAAATGASAEGGGGPELLQVTTSASGSQQRQQKQQQLATAEDTLRGDKGVRVEKSVTTRAYLLRAIALAREEMPLILTGFLCLAVTSTAGLIIPNIQGHILDDVIHPENGNFGYHVVMMVVFSLVTGVFGGLRGLCFSIVGKRILKTLQDRLFSAVIIQDVAYFDATTSGELTSRLTNDVAAMSEPINWQLSALVRNLALLMGGIAMCFLTSWKLSMLAFTTMAPILHITSVYSRWSRDLNRTRYAVLAEANSAASEALGNIRTVRAYSTEDLEIARYKSKTRAAMLKGVRDAIAYSGAVAINNWLDLGASVLILWYGGVQVMNGVLSIGKLITFQLYWNLIQSGYQSVMSVLTSLTKASGAAQRVLTLVDALPDIDPNAGIKVTTLHGAVAFEDVYFHYQMRPDNPVLKGVSLSVKPGQVCALVGRSGGGKSTLVHLLLRFYDPVSGRVLLDGCDLRDLNLKSVHRAMGLVAQETQMWATSIEENITYGLESYTRAQVERAARYANAHNFIMDFPEGYATRVGERGVRLSGGQRQRIAIARMLLRRPSVLVLDEATSALDTESEALVQEALDRLIAEGGKTIVLVAHRLSTVRRADIIGVIDSGKIVEQGTHDTLLGIQNGVYERLVRRQLSKSRNTIGSSEAAAAAAAAADRIDVLIDDSVQDDVAASISAVSAVSSGASFASSASTVGSSSTK